MFKSYAAPMSVLIILDVNLPDGNGFELCKKIKAVQDTPVVFLTARDLEADEDSLRIFSRAVVSSWTETALYPSSSRL